MSERRVYPPKEFESLVGDLADEVFGQKHKVLVFAAALGFDIGVEQELEKPAKGEGIRLDVFLKANDGAFIDAVAVHHAGTLQVLAEDRLGDRIEIFESYAFRGLKLLKEELSNTGTRSDLIVNLVLKSRPGEDKPVSLDDIF